MKAAKKLGIAVIVLAVLVAGFFIYINMAYPKVKCEGAIQHLDVPEKYQDCVTCHEVTSPKVVEDWKESKHGVMLVKCVVCHGEPDGKGSVPFERNPDPKRICAQCHAPAMQRMVEKYGDNSDCNSCHPNHQNAMHGDGYTPRIPSTKTTLE